MTTFSSITTLQQQQDPKARASNDSSFSVAHPDSEQNALSIPELDAPLHDPANGNGDSSNVPPAGNHKSRFCPPAQTPPEQSLAVPSGAALVGIHAFADFLALSRDTAVASLAAANVSGNMGARIAAMTELAKVTSSFELLSRFHSLPVGR